MRLINLPFVAAALLSACVPVIPGTPPPVGPGDACGAAQLQVLLGQPVTVLPDIGPWSTIRVIRPGQAVTMDYSETRLNVEVDAADRIIRIFCG
jgi:hypothetical protein